jgi:hypothetical protein
MSTMLPKGQTTAATTYSFSSQPKAVTAGRKKFRDPGEEDTSMYRDLKETCITWDKRVHRGNTYSIYKQNEIKEALQESVQTTARVRRRRPVKEPSVFDMPLPEPERKPVDLSKHLIATEEKVATDAVECQTDKFLPEPPPEQYQPQKTGIDKYTQVEDGELFDFDREVDPILDVLVNKTLEQSIMEVEEEHEMEDMKEFKSSWYKRQEMMMKDWENQVDEERERYRRTQVLMDKQREQKCREAKVLLKIQAIALANRHHDQLVPDAVEDLRPVAFYDMKGMAIDRIFLPQLLGQARKEVQSMKETQRSIDESVKDSIRKQQNFSAEAFAKQRERTKELEQQRLEELQLRQGKMRIVVDDGSGGKVAVGPIQVSSNEGIEEVLHRVEAWMSENEPKVASAFPWGVILCIDGVPIEATKEIFEAKAGQLSMVPKPEPLPDPEEGEAEEGEGEGDEAEADNA